MRISFSSPHARTHARHFRHSLFPSFFIDTPYAPNGRCNTRTKMKRKKKKRKKKRTTRPKGRVGVGRDRNLTTRSLEGLAPKTVWLSSVSVTRREEGKVVGWVGGWVGRSVGRILTAVTCPFSHPPNLSIGPRNGDLFLPLFYLSTGSRTTSTVFEALRKVKKKKKLKFLRKHYSEGCVLRRRAKDSR